MSLFLKQVSKVFGTSVMHFFREFNVRKTHRCWIRLFSTPVTTRHITFLSHINDEVEEFQEEDSLYSTNTILFVPEGCCVLRTPSAICTHVPGNDVNTRDSPQAAGKIPQHPGAQSRPFVCVHGPFPSLSPGRH